MVPWKSLAMLLLGSTVVACLLLVAGCGGSGRLSDGEYKARLNTLNQEVTNAETAAQTTVGPTATVSAIRSALTRVASVHQQVGDEVAKLKPPKEAADANALLARGSHDLASELRAVVQKLKPVTKTTVALGLVQQELQNANGAKELDRAVTELKKLGLSSGS